MNGLARLTLTAIALGGLAAGTAPAGAKALAGTPDRQPCHVYLHQNLPAPKRCFRYFRDALGPDVYVRGNFVFRNREAYARFLERGPGGGEERMASKAEDHYTASNEHGTPNQERSIESDGTEKGAAPPPPEEPEGASGGASRGPGHMYAGQSGGASRGSGMRENRSGGASSGY